MHHAVFRLNHFEVALTISVVSAIIYLPPPERFHSSRSEPLHITYQLSLPLQPCLLQSRHSALCLQLTPSADENRDILPSLSLLTLFMFSLPVCV